MKNNQKDQVFLFAKEVINTILYKETLPDMDCSYFKLAHGVMAGCDTQKCKKREVMAILKREAVYKIC